MRIVCFSDLHSHNYAQFATSLPGGRNSRLQTVLDVLSEIQSFCEENGVDVLIFCGDLFHSRTKLDVDVLSSTWLAMRSLCKSVKRAFILCGNHDMRDKAGRIHSLEAFRPFATVVDTPVIERVGESVMAFHPFTERMDEWRAFVKMMPNVDFFFGHQGVTEATFGAYDISIKAEVNFSDLPLDKARWIVFGHYHAHQQLGKKFFYVGSPLQHSFSERTEAKGFLYFDTEAGLGFNSAEPEFIETSAPSFLLLEEREELEKRLDSPVPLERDYVRFRTRNAHDADWVGIHWPRVQVELVSEGKTEERRVDKEALQSDRTLLQTYIDEVGNGMGSAKLLEMGMELMARGEE